MLPVRRGNCAADGIRRGAFSPEWRRMGAALMGLLFPRRCVGCGNPFQPSSRAERSPADAGAAQGLPALGAVLCPACLPGFIPVTSPLCHTCGMMFTSPAGEDRLCGDCLTRPKPFGRARATGVYEGPLRTLIREFKFGGRTTLARPLGELAFETFQRHWEPERIDLVLPVPLHARRMRRRGFNQAWLLIRDWPERYRKTRGKAGIFLSRKALTRHRRTPPQTGLDGDHRRRNIKNAFSVPDEARLAGKHILLVDDVYTTGATVGECARVLLAANAGRVDVLTLARTMKPQATRRPVRQRREGAQQ